MGYISKTPHETFAAVADPEQLSKYFTTGGARGRLVTVTEESWNTTVGGAEGAFGNCMGWTGMLAAMKAWVEYGIDLREGFYK